MEAGSTYIAASTRLTKNLGRPYTDKRSTGGSFSRRCGVGQHMGVLPLETEKHQQKELAY